MSSPLIVWDEELLRYNMGDHPLDPVRVELTMALARSLGVLDRPGVTVQPPQPPTDEILRTVHDPDYIAVVKAASTGRRVNLMGLGTADNPTFAGMHDASALIVGAPRRAAEAVWLGEADRAVSISGGLHHAMPDRAAGFCVYNDPAVAIARLLELRAERIASVANDV